MNFSPLIIVLIVVAVFVLVFTVFYNRFVKLVNQAKEAWSDIEVQLKRRYDLIPNLINTVKGYATHEQGVFEKVTEARAKAMSGEGATKDHAEAENMLTSALKSVFAVAEAYPDLKANTNFIELQELSDTENKVQASRRFYNGTVRDLNIAVESFPSNIVAKMFHFIKMDLFDLPDNDEAQKVPEVKF